MFVRPSVRPSGCLFVEKNQPVSNSKQLVRQVVIQRHFMLEKHDEEEKE